MSFLGWIPNDFMLVGPLQMTAGHWGCRNYCIHTYGYELQMTEAALSITIFIRLRLPVTDDTLTSRIDIYKIKERDYSHRGIKLGKALYSSSSYLIQVLNCGNKEW